jgi:hypothetical protein
MTHVHPELTPAEAEARHLQREGVAMGLYVSIYLLVATAVAGEALSGNIGVLAIVWGTTVGLVPPHWFAFHLASRLIDPEAPRHHLYRQLAVQIIAAASVGAVATLLVLVVPPESDHKAARYAAAGCIGGITLLHSRAYGRPWTHSVMAAVGALLIGLAVAGVTHALGH